MLRVATAVDHDAHDDKDDNGNDLEERQPVLDLSVDAHSHKVEAEEDEPEDETERPSWEVVGPVLEQKLKRNEVGSGRDSVVEPVVPREREPVGVINEAAWRERSARRAA